MNNALDELHALLPDNPWHVGDEIDAIGELCISSKGIPSAEKYVLAGKLFGDFCMKQNAFVAAKLIIAALQKMEFTVAYSLANRATLVSFSDEMKIQIARAVAEIPEAGWALDIKCHADFLNFIMLLLENNFELMGCSDKLLLMFLQEIKATNNPTVMVKFLALAKIGYEFTDADTSKMALDLCREVMDSRDIHFLLAIGTFIGPQKGVLLGSTRSQTAQMNETLEQHDEARDSHLPKAKRIKNTQK